jgi:hypothetical protein
VAGIRLKVGAGAGVGRRAGGGRGARGGAGGAGREGGGKVVGLTSGIRPGARDEPDAIGCSSTILPPVLLSDGVVLSSGKDDETPARSSSSSIGRSSTSRKMGVAGDAERVTGKGPGVSRRWSGTSRSRSSIWMRDRKVSSEPANRPTVPSMASTLWLVRAVCSATLSKPFIRSSSTARRTATSERV